MPATAVLHLTLAAGPARDAVAAALAEQGFTVQPTPTGSLDVSRGSLGATLVAGALAGRDMHVRFDVHVRDVADGAVAEFEHSGVGGFFKGGAVGAVKAGDVVREAAHGAGVRLAARGLLHGAAPLPPAPDSTTAAAPDSTTAAAPAYAGAVPPAAPPAYGAPVPPAGSPAPGAAYIPPPVDYANRTNILSIFALILGFLVPLGGIIAGAVGLAQVKRTGEKGRGLAIAGIVVGSVMTVLSIVAVVLFFAFVIIGAAAQEAQGPSDGGFVDPDQGAPAEVLSLQVGECLDDVASGIVSSDNLVDCALPHTYEVFADVSVPDGAYPGDDEIGAYAQQECDPAFAAYVGLSYEESTLDYSYVGPSSDTWDQGDRQIACLLTDPAGETTGSLQGAAR
ncbi:septum formation family protein [Microbacterium sp. NPDC091313]